MSQIKKSLLHIIPYSHFTPPQNGGALRCYHLCVELSKYFNVTVITYQNSNTVNDPLFKNIKIINPKTPLQVTGLKNKVLNALKHRWCQRTCKGPAESAVLQFYPILKHLSQTENYDYVIMEHLSSIQLGKSIKRLFPKALRIADQHNVDHLLHQQNNDLNCPKHKQTFNYLKIQESNLYKNADCFFACSEADKVALETVNDHRLEGFVVPNGTTNKPVKRHILDVLEPKLIFCGSLDYNPNKNGLLWFYETIWPSLKTSIKGLTLTVIGRNGFDKAYAPLKIDKQIDFVGEVKDVTPYYLKNNIAIVPLLEGSGTRLKILEAMSFGLPVISTSIGAEGIDYIENKHIIIANDAALFQQAIIDNIKKPAILKKIGKQSSMLITEKYTWQKIVRKMAENLISNEN